ncbi:MAG: hypothetical protein A2066_08675 [Bacteroidetes bacterium GWB2_41_8]|nr:MAG: hypothetical protein A2066_08675 [Bacteroidetes bacterium GWB2_41_8]
MTTKLSLTFLFLLLLSTLHSQTIIHGTVTDSENSPIPYATVYLSKTTMGVLANQFGVYTLTIPPNGTYEMIASCVGYHSRSQIINANGSNKNINIRLRVKTIELKEVVVQGKDRNRQLNYELFLKNFIGRTMNSPMCKIENPKDLIIYRTSNDSNLIAYSKKPLIIENSGLGYKIIYDLKNFNHNLKTKHLRFSGDYYFQDIAIGKRQYYKVHRNRLIAYYGSRMHFLRALFADLLAQENFLMINTKRDSATNYWITADTLTVQKFRHSQNADSITLFHDRPIEIKYSDNHPELFPLPHVYRPGTYTSRIYFADTVSIYRNGFYPEYFGLSWGGNMSFDRIAELLPYDFIPKPPKN